MAMAANPAEHLATDSVVDQFTDGNTGLQLLSPQLITTAFNPSTVASKMPHFTARNAKRQKRLQSYIKRLHSRPKRQTETQTIGQCGINAGRWLGPEHERFLQAMELYGNNFLQVAVYVRTRTKTQCRTHNQKHQQKLKEGRTLAVLAIGEEQRRCAMHGTETGRELDVLPPGFVGAALCGGGAQSQAGGTKRKLEN
jgi:hypothetical protein